MPINVRREFSSVGLASGNGVFAPAPLPSGELEATRAVGGATLQRFRVVADAIDTETRSLAQRGEAVQRFGADLQMTGQTLRRTFDAVEEQQRQAFQRHRAATARTEFTCDADEIVRRAVVAAGPSGIGLADTASRRLHEQRERRVREAAIDDDAVRAALDDQLAHIAARAEIAARKQQIGIETGFLKSELDKRIGTVAAQALALPGEPEQAQLIQLSVDDIRDAVDEGLLAPGKAEQKIAALRTTLLERTVADLAAQDPARGLALLNGGRLDHLLANDGDRADTAAELARGRDERDAREGKALESEVEDDLALRRTTGSGRPGLRRRVAELGGPDAVAAFDRQAADAATYFEVAEAVRWATPAQAQAIVDALRPPAGMARSAEPVRRYRIAVGALADRNKALDDDPVAYAAQQPAVNDRTQNIAQQRALGREDYGFYSKREAAARVASFAAATLEERPDILRGWLSEASKHKRQATKDLRRAGLPPSAALLLPHANDPGMQDVVNRTLAAEQRGREVLAGELGSDDARSLRQVLGDELDAYQRSMRAAGPDGALFFEQVRHTAELLALSYATTGTAPATAARAAANGLVNDHYTYQDGYRVPVAFNAGAVGDFAAQLLAAWPAADAAAQAAGVDVDGTGTDDLRWHNTTDETGLMLVRADGSAVVDADGQQIGFRFDEGEAEGRLLAALSDGLGADSAAMEARQRRSSDDAPPVQEAALPAAFVAVLAVVSRAAARLLPRLPAPGRAVLRERLKAQVGRQLRADEDGNAKLNIDELGSDITPGDAVMEFAELAVAEDLTPHAGQKAELDLGPMTDEMIDRARAQSGFDARGFRIVIPSDDARHTYNRHGPDGETDDRNISLTLEDFGSLPALMADFDHAHYRPPGPSRPAALTFRKRVNGTVFWVEIIGRRKGRLAFKTMWKRKK